MLDDKDIEKIIKAQKEAFVAKEEFESFLEIVVTKDDIEEIKEEMATKADVKEVKGDINKIVNMLGKMDEKLDEVVGLKHRVEYIENTLNIPALKVNKIKS